MKKILSLILISVWFNQFSQEIEILRLADVYNLNNGSVGTSIFTRPSPQDEVQAYRLLGSSIVCETVGSPILQSNVSTPLVDNQLKLVAVVIPRTYTVTGVQVYVTVNGVYTADQNNKVGLYSYNNGTLTLVASSTNTTTLFTLGLNTCLNIPFSSPYVATQGIYFVGILYNNSAQVTAPSLASGVAISNVAKASPSTTNSAKLYSTLAVQNDLPATTTMLLLTSSLIPSWVALY